MRFLLIMPPLVYAEQWTRNRTAHLLNLYSWVRKALPDVETTVVDLGYEMTSLERPDDLPRLRAVVDDLLEDHDPDVVGISCWTSLHYVGTVEIAQRVKRRSRRTPVVVGGYHATALPHDFDHPPGTVDYVVVGEGELALADLLRDTPSTSPIGPRIIVGKPLPMDEEELLFDEYPYHIPGNFQLFLSRGCPFPCAFCVEPTMVEMRGKTWRHYSWDKTEHLLRDLVERRGARYVAFYDALFGAKKEYRHRIWELLGSFDSPPAVWCETRVDLLDETDYDAIARLPIQLDVGLDAVTVESVRRMRKASRPTAYLSSFQRLCEAMAHRGKGVSAYLIVNYPGETVDTLGQTVEATERITRDLQSRFGRSNLWLGVQTYKLFPGAPDYRARDELEKIHGCRFPNDGWWRETGPDLEARASSSVASRELLAAGGLGAVTSAMDAIRDLCRERGSSDVKRNYELEAAEPVPCRGMNVESVLGERPDRLDPLVLELSRFVELVADVRPGASVLYDALKRRSITLPAENLGGLLRAILRAPTLGAGLAQLDERARSTARVLVPHLVTLGYLRPRLPESALPASSVRFETRAGPIEIEACDDEAADLLGALVDTEYLVGLRPVECWYRAYLTLAVPHRAAPLPETSIPTPGAWALLRTTPSRSSWPLLALATQPSQLPERAAWRPLGRVVDGAATLARLSVHTQITGAERVGARSGNST